MHPLYFSARKNNARSATSLPILFPRSCRKRICSILSSATMTSEEQQTRLPMSMDNFPGGKSGGGSRLLGTNIPHPQLRFHYPRMSNTPVPDEEKLRNTTSLHSKEKMAPPMPVIVKHGWEKTLGVIEGDHHSKNTNPGFSRNCLGGFFTQ